MLPRGAANRRWAEAEEGALLPAGHAPQCFPPNAVFQQVDGPLITASQLTKNGGEVLLGPDNSHVRVMCTKRHGLKERCFLKIHTAQSMLEVTHDHRIIGQWPQGSEVSIAAINTRPHLRTGVGLQPVQSFEVDFRLSDVVEPIFEHDAPVLVWTRPGRKLKSAPIENAFAVRGGLCDVSDLFEMKHGFYDAPRELETSSTARSRSADNNLTPADQRRLARSRSSWLSRPLPTAMQERADGIDAVATQFT